jgi:hypothetical protein
VAQFHPAHGGVVPEKTVAPAGQQKRDADLAVELQQVNDAAFLVEASVLVLAQAVKAFILVGLKL